MAYNKDFVKNQHLNIKNTFSVIKNNGVDDESKYTNSCLIISIQQFLKYSIPHSKNSELLNKQYENYTVEQLRKMCNYDDICGKNEIFDTDKIGHCDAITRLVKKLDMTIYIYCSNCDNHTTWISKPAKIFNRDPSSTNHISIVSYGLHFELIISKTLSTQKLWLDMNKIKKNNEIIIYDFNQINKQITDNQNKQITDNQNNQNNQNKQNKQINKSKNKNNYNYNCNSLNEESTNSIKIISIHEEYQKCFNEIEDLYATNENYNFMISNNYLSNCEYKIIKSYLDNNIKTISIKQKYIDSLKELLINNSMMNN